MGLSLIIMKCPDSGDEDESRLTGPLAVQLLKALPAKSCPPPVLDGPIREVISDLLDALAVKTPPRNQAGKEPLINCFRHCLKWQILIMYVLGTLGNTADAASVEVAAHGRASPTNGVRSVFGSRQELSRNGSTSDLLQQDDDDQPVSTAGYDKLL